MDSKGILAQARPKSLTQANRKRQALQIKGNKRPIGLNRIVSHMHATHNKMDHPFVEKINCKLEPKPTDQAWESSQHRRQQSKLWPPTSSSALHPSGIRRNLMAEFIWSMNGLTIVKASAITLVPDTSYHRTKGASHTPLLNLRPG